ncbi:LuxR family transcriptional regulator [Aquibium carbonis]|uniref:LuxR family transcriptional regulator n=1 Tax=Aquibium carbonis TaxID=2495581 RepID=A0A429YWN2_9HYPH|nr:helix-turn-helix transcriptional regulator [Aquibium carbonis]RST85868.1 LuxR family transcriptional regulator [Aquibium carbonis]
MRIDGSTLMLARPKLSRGTLAAIAAVESSAQFRHCLGLIAAETGASHHLLLLERHVRGESAPHVVASNWVYDTVQEIGADELQRHAQAMASAEASIQPGGAAPRGNATANAEGAARSWLHRLGHAEVHVLPVRDAWRRCHLFLSSPLAGSIDQAALPLARLACCYLLSRAPKGLFDDISADTLSERERECLHWVAEGKTAGEVAMILGVTANTVNSYLNHAIRKVGASNRAMAIASAIRAGMI